MPELPEVETTRRGLELRVLGKTITAVRVIVPKMLKPGVVETAEAFCDALTETQINKIDRRGKYLIFHLSSGYYLLFHLKMRGRITVATATDDDGKYLALGVRFEDGSELRFYDIWTWGEFRLLDSAGLESHEGIRGMGVEPLSEDFTCAVFIASLSRRPKSTIKAALLDQSTLAGVGNIYADESLFRSGIRPDRLAGSLKEDDVDRLRSKIREVLTEAIGDGGTASDNYFDAENRPGRYVPQVYDQGGKPCPRCSEQLIRTRIAGRGTVYCAACQS